MPFSCGLCRALTLVLSFCLLHIVHSACNITTRGTQFVDDVGRVRYYSTPGITLLGVLHHHHNNNHTDIPPSFSKWCPAEHWYTG